MPATSRRKTYRVVFGTGFTFIASHIAVGRDTPRASDHARKLPRSGKLLAGQLAQEVHDVLGVLRAAPVGARAGVESTTNTWSRSPPRSEAKASAILPPKLWPRTPATLPPPSLGSSLERARECVHVGCGARHRVGRRKAARVAVQAEVDEHRPPARPTLHDLLRERAPVRARAEDAVEEHHPPRAGRGARAGRGRGRDEGVGEERHAIRLTHAARNIQGLTIGARGLDECSDVGYDLLAALLFAALPLVILGFVGFSIMTSRDRANVAETWQRYASRHALAFEPPEGEWPNRTSPVISWSEEASRFASSRSDARRTRADAPPRSGPRARSSSVGSPSPRAAT